MNLRLSCLLCTLALNWFVPCPSRGQPQNQVIERPADAAGAAEWDEPLPKRSRGRSMGDVVTMGNNVFVKEGETAHDVVVFGGQATIEGTVTGDLVVLMGNARLGSNAVVRRDVVVVGG